MAYVRVPKGSSAIVYEDLPELGRFLYKSISEIPSRVSMSSRQMVEQVDQKREAERVQILKTKATQGLPVEARLEAQDELVRLGAWTETDLIEHMKHVHQLSSDNQLPEDVRLRYLSEITLRQLD